MPPQRPTSHPLLNGIEKWNYPVFEGLKRFSELVDSPYHGFNFCCGVAAEGLENPAEELPPIIKYFAERKKNLQHTLQKHPRRPARLLRNMAG